MNKKIVIIGSVIIVLAVASMVVLNINDFLASTTYDTGVSATYQNDSSFKVVFNQGITTQDIGSLYSSASVYVLITSTQQDQEFNISLKLGITGGTPVLGVCHEQLSCIISSKIVTIPSIGNQTFGVTANERRLPIEIPFLVSGSPIPSSVAREYSISVSSVNGGSYTYQYEGYAKSHFAVFISLAVFIIGIIITVLGFVFGRSSSKAKPMKKRSWQEPTLGGSSNSSRFSSNSSSKSKKSNKNSGSASSSRHVSTSVNCKKCGGVMPRNSQYCPHCYTRQ